MTKGIWRTVTANIARGIKFLNKEYGRSWVRRIDLETLALKSGCSCVLGQLEGTYYEALDLFKLSEKKAEKLGFRTEDDWEVLNSLWQNKIRSLKQRG